MAEHVTLIVCLFGFIVGFAILIVFAPRIVSRSRQGPRENTKRSVIFFLGKKPRPRRLQSPSALDEPKEESSATVEDGSTIVIGAKREAYAR